MRKTQAELPNYTLEMKYPEQSSAAVQNRLLDDLRRQRRPASIPEFGDPKTVTDELNKVAARR